MKKLIFALLAILLSNLVFAQFNLVGSAVGSAGSYNLTPPSSCGAIISSGAIWSTSTVDFTHSFTLQYDALFDMYSGGADGICAVFGDRINTAAGTGSYNYKGGCLGYYNYTWGGCGSWAGSGSCGHDPDFDESVAVEFDIFNNTCANLFDPPYDHAAICQNGFPQPLHWSGTPCGGSSPDGGPVLINGVSGIKDNKFHTYDIIWCPIAGSTPLTGHFIVLLDGGTVLLNTLFIPSTVFLSSPITAINWGFTGATQSDCSNQEIKNISISTSGSLTVNVSIQLCSASSVTLPAPGPPFSYTMWSTGSTAPSITVSSSGIYSVQTACSCVKLKTVYNVAFGPVPGPISGTGPVCIGGSINLTDPTTGGTWSSDGYFDVIGPATGIETGMNGGTGTVTYTLPDGCFVTAPAIVDSSTVGPVIGPSTLCEGSTVTLTDITPGGTWSGGGTYATISAMGVVTPITGTSGGIDIFTYTATSGTCTNSAYIYIDVIAYRYPCVTVSCTGCGPYMYTFTSTIPVSSSGYIVYDIVNSSGITCAGPFTMPFPAAPVPAASFYASASCPGDGICIIGLTDSGCYWGSGPVPPWPTTPLPPLPHDCCALQNPGISYRSGNLINGNTSGEVSSAISLLPNPNNGVLHITGTMPAGTDEQSVNMEVLDVSGNIIITDIASLDKGIINKTITINSNIANGTYMLKLKTTKGDQLFKFTLER